MVGEMKSICSYPGCAEIIEYGARRCARHPIISTKIGVDPYYKSVAWRRLRASQLARRPLCKMCLDVGITKVADTADHVIPRKAGGSDCLSNLQSLCRSCHAKKSHIDGSLSRG